jgi:hypothetical protein
VQHLLEQMTESVNRFRDAYIQQRKGLEELSSRRGGGEPHPEKATASLLDREFERMAGLASKLQDTAKQRALAWETFQRSVRDGDARDDPQTEGAEGRAETRPPNRPEHGQGVNRPDRRQPSANP